MSINGARAPGCEVAPSSELLSNFEQFNLIAAVAKVAALWAPSWARQLGWLWQSRLGVTVNVGELARGCQGVGPGAAGFIMMQAASCEPAGGRAQGRAHAAPKYPSPSRRPRTRTHCQRAETRQA